MAQLHLIYQEGQAGLASRVRIIRDLYHFQFLVRRHAFRAK
ncbi:hypothetical protein [Rubinisphaera italica]|nr:hypothetical protein [Rubinisphaera italica]